MYSDKDYTLEIIEQGHEVLDDSEKDLVTEKHLTYFQLSDSLVTDYIFKKKDCKWFLAEKNTLPLNKYKGKEFIQFMVGISTDTSFLKAHTNYPLKYEYFGDSFSKEVKYITKEEENILDFFGKGYILFLNSGNISEMKEFYIALRGTGNGMNSTYNFKEVNGTWVLTEYSDFST